MNYSKDRLLENEMILEDIGNKIWSFYQSNKEEYELIEDSRHNFLEALSSMLYATSGVNDKRVIGAIECDPQSNLPHFSIAFEAFEDDIDMMSKFESVIRSASSFNISTYEEMVVLKIEMPAMWNRKVAL